MTSSTFAVRGRLLFGTHLEPGTLIASDGRIERIVRGHLSDGNLPPGVMDADIVTPGLIDLQVNGADGVEVDENPRHIEHISRWSLPSGVTAWLPTIVTAAADYYPPVFAGFAGVDTSIGATPLGLHLEGPFLAPARKGAHQLRYIEEASEEIFQEWLRQTSIRLVTLAPEREGNLARIQTLVERGVLVSLGHTDATYEQFAAGIDAGANKATHLFNAMSPMHHRQPGAMIATLTDDRVTSGLIPDAVHSHPATVRLAFRAKGPDRIAIVSDMMSATGLGEGTYELGGQKVTVTGLAARLVDGTLAGSVITMDQAIRNVVEWADVPVGSAMHMATGVPARLIGDATRGRLVEGARADLALWSRDLRVVGTVVAGERVWAEAPVS
jgi:N-acetylglucosamine-6-phosphate deacetylase